MKTMDLNRYMNHQVAVHLTEGKARELKADDCVVTGKVTKVSNSGIILSARSTTTILLAEDITDIRIRRGRVVVRMVRVFSDRDDVRQHLADRHGLWIGLLRSLSPEAAHAYHEKIDHADLGHKHGDKPGTQVVDPDQANRAMEALDEMELED